jgi:valyl-tRNA synthetase
LLDQAPHDVDESETEWTLADSWIWARLKHLAHNVDRLFESYQYGEAGRQIYEFFWSEFADWYLEIAKLQIAEGGARAKKTARTLTRILDTGLRMLHPYTPFVTEELWGHLRSAAEKFGGYLAPKDGWEDALIVAKWPEPIPFGGWEDEFITNFELLMDLVRSIRNLRAEKQVKPGTKIGAIFAGGDHRELLEQQALSLSSLAGLDPNKMTFTDTLKNKPEGHVALVSGSVEVYLPLADLVDPAEERSRLEKDLAEADRQIQRLDNLLNSPFADKAPPDVVEKERQKLADFKDSAEKIKAQLAEH